jgi:hypothetical protein
VYQKEEQDQRDCQRERRLEPPARQPATQSVARGPGGRGSG